MIRATFLALAVLLLAATIVEAQVYVRPYVRRDGGHVTGHYRSYADGNFWNNWSTTGNVNPYTGSLGTRSYPSYGSSYRSSFDLPPYRPRYRWDW